MRNVILILVLMMFMASSAHAHACTLERKVLRNWFLGECPEDSYVVASRVNHYGNFTYTYLRCEEIKLVCDETKPLWGELCFDKNSEEIDCNIKE